MCSNAFDVNILSDIFLLAFSLYLACKLLLNYSDHSEKGEYLALLVNLYTS